MLKNGLSLVLKKWKIMHEFTKIDNRREELIAIKISSTDWVLKVDDRRKFDREWFQYLEIQYVHFVKESTEKDGIESTSKSKSKSSKKCFEVLINATITIDNLKHIIIHNQSHVSVIFDEMNFVMGILK